MQTLTVKTVGTEYCRSQKLNVRYSRKDKGEVRITTPTRSQWSGFPNSSLISISHLCGYLRKHFSVWKLAAPHKQKSVLDCCNPLQSKQLSRINRIPLSLQLPKPFQSPICRRVLKQSCWQEMYWLYFEAFSSQM